MDNTPSNPSQEPKSETLPIGDIPKESGKTFINAGSQPDLSTESVFNYMTDGKEFSRAPKPKENLLWDYIIRGLWVVTLILLILSVLTFFDTWLRWQEDNTLIQNYSVFCSYLTRWLENYPENKNCSTVSMIQKSVDQEKKTLENQIAERLEIYLPIKIQQGSLFAPEQKLIDSVLKKRISLLSIMSTFEEMEMGANVGKDNIECEWVQMTSKWLFNTRCKVYGERMGEIGDTGGVWSARVEAMRFVDLLWKPTESHFIVTAPPASLNIETINPNNEEKPWFYTTTFLPLQLQYVPPFDTASNI